MIKNYIKIAWRSLLRNTTFSVINVVGLALGIAVFIFIMQYVTFEWGANRFHKNYDKLYRVSMVDKKGAGEYYIPPGYAPIFKTTFPAIEDFVRIADGSGNGIVSVNGRAGSNNKDVKSFREDKVSYADGNFFKVFSFKVISGNASLNEPQTLVLSASTAEKYFGNVNAVGKTLVVNNQFGNTPYTVTGIFEDMPAQSDIKADILLSFQTLYNAGLRNGNDWADPKNLQSGYVNVYFLLNSNINLNSVTNGINTTMHRLNPDTKTDALVFQPMSDLHLAPSFGYHLQTFGNLLLVTLFLGVALLILVIAWVNYMNLSIAQSFNRAREIGMRKVLGAIRRQLIVQFLCETLLITLTAVGIALILVYLLQPVYNSFLGKVLSLSVLNSGWFWLAGLSLIAAGSVLSGSYVAFVLSSFNPVKTMGSKIGSLTGGISLRKSLVVFQFTVSVVFIIATLVLYRQLSFMKTQNLGMQIDQRLVIAGPSVNKAKAGSISFKNKLANLPFVQKYAASNNIPGKGYNFSAAGITRINPAPGDEKKNFSMLDVDDKFFDTYGIQFFAGQNFTAGVVEQGYTKAATVIINQKAAQQLGFKTGEPIVGQKIMWDNAPFQIAGVVKDYHHLSLHEAIQPMVFLPAVSSGYYTLKMSTYQLAGHLNTIKNLYQSQFPGNPFEYFFLDENYDKQYKSEQNLGSVFIASALVAILIACLGLFGLASFTAQQRTKEIGIRKVLGANVAGIVQLISADFLKLVLLAIFIASPIAWYALNAWLQDFAYRIAINWWLFVLAGGVAIVIAFITISFQSVKAALANPVKSLRNE